MTDYHSTRLSEDKRRDVLWRVVTRYLQRYVPSSAVVLDFGAGHCGFINHIRAGRKIAYDQWTGISDYKSGDVEAIVGHYTELAKLGDGSLDVVFASNVFEHFEAEELGSVLEILRGLMTPRARLILVQPNFYYAYRQYFDDYTHKSIWTHRSLPDFLNVNGFNAVDVRPAFLPLTVKSRLPVHPLLIEAYLRSPIKPMAGQMLVVAERRE